MAMFGTAAALALWVALGCRAQPRSRAEDMVTIYRKHVLGYEVYEMSYFEERDHRTHTAMAMLGVFLVMAVICALWVHVKREVRKMTSKMESSHCGSVGAPPAAPHAPKEDRDAVAFEGAPVAAPPPQASVEPEPSPPNTQCGSVWPGLRLRRASQTSSFFGNRGHGGKAKLLETVSSALVQPEALEVQAARTAEKNTAQTQTNKVQPGEKLEETVYYTCGGLNTGIFHSYKLCQYLYAAKNVHESTLDFSRRHQHRSCNRCGKAQTAGTTSQAKDERHGQDSQTSTL